MSKTPKLIINIKKDPYQIFNNFVKEKCILDPKFRCIPKIFYNELYLFFKDNGMSNLRKILNLKGAGYHDILDELFLSREDILTDFSNKFIIGVLIKDKPESDYSLKTLHDEDIKCISMERNIVKDKVRKYTNINIDNIRDVQQNITVLFNYFLEFNKKSPFIQENLKKWKKDIINPNIDEDSLIVANKIISNLT